MSGKKTNDQHGGCVCASVPVPVPVPVPVSVSVSVSVSQSVSVPVSVFVSVFVSVLWSVVPKLDSWEFQTLTKGALYLNLLGFRGSAHSVGILQRVGRMSAKCSGTVATHRPSSRGTRRTCGGVVEEWTER